MKKKKKCKQTSKSALNPKIRERKLRSGVNLTRDFKAKSRKTKGRKTRYGCVCIREGPMSIPGEDTGCPE